MVKTLLSRWMETQFPVRCLYPAAEFFSVNGVEFFSPCYQPVYALFLSIGYSHDFTQQGFPLRYSLL